MAKKNQFKKGSKKKGSYQPVSRKKLMKRIKISTQELLNPLKHSKEDPIIPDFMEVTLLKKTGIKFKANHKINKKIQEGYSRFNPRKMFDVMKMFTSNERSQEINMTRLKIKKKVEMATFLLKSGVNILLWGFGCKYAAIDDLLSKFEDAFLIIRILAKHKEDNFLEKLEIVLKNVSRKIVIGRYPPKLNQMSFSIDRLIKLYEFFIKKTNLQLLLFIRDFEFCLENSSLYEIVKSFVVNLNSKLVCHTDTFDIPLIISKKNLVDLRLCYFEMNTNQFYLNILNTPIVPKKFNHLSAQDEHFDFLGIMSKSQQFDNKKNIPSCIENVH